MVEKEGRQLVQTFSTRLIAFVLRLALLLPDNGVCFWTSCCTVSPQKGRSVSFWYCFDTEMVKFPQLNRGKGDGIGLLNYLELQGRVKSCGAGQKYGKTRYGARRRAVTRRR